MRPSPSNGESSNICPESLRSHTYSLSEAHSDDSGDESPPQTLSQLHKSAAPASPAAGFSGSFAPLGQQQIASKALEVAQMTQEQSVGLGPDTVDVSRPIPVAPREGHGESHEQTVRFYPITQVIKSGLAS